MAIKKMTLAWITVKDLGKTKKFFSEILGLNITSSSEEWGWLEMQGKEGGYSLGLAQESKEFESEKAGTNAVVTMTCDDLVKTKADMEKKGVRFIGEIMEVPGHVKLVTFVDSDGNKFQLVEELNAQ